MFKDIVLKKSESSPKMCIKIDPVSTPKKCTKYDPIFTPKICTKFDPVSIPKSVYTLKILNQPLKTREKFKF